MRIFGLKSTYVVSLPEQNSLSRRTRNTSCLTPFVARFGWRNLTHRGTVDTVIRVGLLVAQCDRPVSQQSERPTCCPTVDENVVSISPRYVTVLQRLKGSQHAKLSI